MIVKYKDIADSLPAYVNSDFIKEQKNDGKNPGGFGQWLHEHYGNNTYGYNPSSGVDWPRDVSITGRDTEGKSRAITAVSKFTVGSANASKIIQTQGECFMPKLDLWLVVKYVDDECKWRIIKNRSDLIWLETWDFEPHKEFILRNLLALSKHSGHLISESKDLSLLTEEEGFPFILQRSEKSLNSWRLRISDDNLQKLLKGDYAKKLNATTKFNELFSEA